MVARRGLVTIDVELVAGQRRNGRQVAVDIGSRIVLAGTVPDESASRAITPLCGGVAEGDTGCLLDGAPAISCGQWDGRWIDRKIVALCFDGLGEERGEDNCENSVGEHDCVRRSVSVKERSGC